MTLVSASELYSVQTGVLSRYYLYLYWGGSVQVVKNWPIKDWEKREKENEMR